LLGIFQGKKTENNKLILKSLVSGARTTTQIAEYILSTKNAILSKELYEKRVNNIVRIISRRTEEQKGRLHELETKQYIERKNKLWHLTRKGFPIALTLFNSSNAVLQTWDESLELYLQKIIRNMIEKAPPKKNIVWNRELLVEVLSQGAKQNCLQLLPVLRESSDELKHQNINLDEIDAKKFSTMLVDKLLDYYFRV